MHNIYVDMVANDRDQVLDGWWGTVSVILSMFISENFLL